MVAGKGKGKGATSTATQPLVTTPKASLISASTATQPLVTTLKATMIAASRVAPSILLPELQAGLQVRMLLAQQYEHAVVIMRTLCNAHAIASRIFRTHTKGS